MLFFSPFAARLARRHGDIEKVLESDSLMRPKLHG